MISDDRMRTHAPETWTTEDHRRHVVRRPWFVVGWMGGLLVALLCLVLAPALQARPSAQGQQPELQVGEWSLSSVVEWQSGETDGLIISNNAGGELRLAGGRSDGSFTSAAFEAPFPINAVGAVWRANLTEGTDITLEVRGRSLPITTTVDVDGEPVDDEPVDDDADWSAWQPLVAGDARSQAEDGAFATPSVLALPNDTRYLQLRISLDSEVSQASAVLNEVTVAYLNTVQAGPSVPRGLQPIPILYGSDTLTARPTLVPRSTWFTEQPVAVNRWENTPPTQIMTDTWRPGLPNVRPERVVPRGIILHQIDGTDAVSDTLPLLRAIATYQTQVLGWEDMPYHYLIDQDGTLYEGRLGGPRASVSRLSNGDTAVHIALPSSDEGELSQEVQATLVSLLSWLGQAYDVPPAGEHNVLVSDRVVSRQNVVWRGQISPDVPEPEDEVQDLLTQLRDQADQSTVRSRWYFAEGNIQDYTESLTFFNPGSEQVNANVTLISDDADDPALQIVTVPPEGSAELVVSEVLSATTDLSAVVESSGSIIAQRSLAVSTDIADALGVPQPSRVWYFAEGSTDAPFDTYLVLFNPQVNVATATITYLKGDGTISTQDVTVPPSQRIVVTVGDNLPDVGFGARIIADQPIVAERTMRFGPDDAGFHTGPGIAELSQRWYFAEGTTAAPFQMRLLLLNPNEQPANATVTFMTPDGTTLTLERRYAIPPTTRLVVNVNEMVPALGVATKVEADRPIAAERALYFTADDSEAFEPSAGTVSAGATAPAFVWRFVDGSSAEVRRFLLLSNPSANQASVTVELNLEDGEQETQTVVMPANSRYTVAVHELVTDQRVVSQVVRATQPIVAERSVFPDGQGGSTSLGVPE